MLRRIAGVLAAALMLGAGPAEATSFKVFFPANASTKPLDGRLILIVSPKATPEPRLQVNREGELASPFIFGETVDAIAPGASVVLRPTDIGWPVDSLSRLPDGDYTVQAVLNRYETFHRSDGSVVKLPPDMGEGQHWNLKPGNIYSKPTQVHVRHGGPVVALSLDQTIGPIARKPDTAFIKHIRIKSELLSKF